MNRIITLFLIVIFGVAMHGQQPGLSNFHVKIIDAAVRSHILDSLTIDPRGFVLADSATGKVIPRDFYEIKSGTLLLDNQRIVKVFPEILKLRVAWRSFPFDFGKKFARLDSTKIRKNEGQNSIAYDFTPFEQQKDLFDAAGMRYTGNYSRGFSIGNSQNLAFNSNLNLQMDGKIGDDLTVRAAISDNSIPIQPEGTTRQLQEFDRIFIQISRKNASLLAGDFDLGTRQGVAPSQFSTANSLQSTGYFTRFFKKTKGAAVDWHSESGQNSKKDTLLVQAAIGVAKGKFSRQTLKVGEGNQGPYRLQGAENERFIIVLAGTEKVWLDGQLLRRGIEDDFVMDYNLGEISFTARRLITAASRVIVEFEYADQDFLRSTVAGGGEWRVKKGRVFGHIYSEQDSKTAGSLQNLSISSRHALRDAGDRPVFATGIDTATFAADRVLYKLVNGVACGQPIDSVLVFSTNADSARFSAKFTEVVMGQGDYILVTSNANGRVFRWVEPDPLTCERRGNFVPFIRLSAPQQLQMFTLGADYQVVKHGKASLELAMSRRDLNRFSGRDSGDDLGFAMVSGWQHAVFIGKKTNGIRLSTAAKYELAGQHFSAINPYRPAEFTRDWNVEKSTAPALEHLVSAAVSMSMEKTGAVSYSFGLFNRAGFYAGYKHGGSIFFEKNGWAGRADASQLTSNGEFERTKFLRPKLDLSKILDKKSGLRTGIYFEKERNERHPTSQPDSLGKASFEYNLGKIYVDFPSEKGKLRFGSALQNRTDFASNGKNFKKNTSANELSINGLWQISKQNQLLVNLAARDFKVLDSTLTNLKPQRTYLGKTDYALTAWRGALGLNLNYETGSGQEAKIQYVYQKTDPGLGQFYWNDRNGDGLITVDEIETPAFSDQANVLRVVLPTNDFVRTNNVSFSHNLRLDPRAAWSNPLGARRFFARFSAQNEWQLVSKARSDAAGGAAWNPFSTLTINDTNLVTASSTLRNSVFFNRANPIWDVQFEQKDNRARLNLASGFESRRQSEINGRARLSWRRAWTANFQVGQGQKANEAQLLVGRDFRIDYVQVQPALTWQPGQKWRTSLRGRLLKSQNSIQMLGSGGEKARQRDFSSETTVSLYKQKSGWVASTRLNLKGTFSKIDFTGKTGTALAFTMLEGLQPGENWVWNLGFDRQLSRYLTLNLSYEGRKTSAIPVVHVGRMQVRANF